ncbi:MAG TPA: hypothetical protein VEJ84_03490, partial [Acidimicrobiales bacterium]|nr:hypothetical protein [Acidimicrobiales bacterium]
PGIDPAPRSSPPGGTAGGAAHTVARPAEQFTRWRGRRHGRGRGRRSSPPLWRGPGGVDRPGGPPKPSRRRGPMLSSLTNPHAART